MPLFSFHQWRQRKICYQGRGKIVKPNKKPDLSPRLLRIKLCRGYVKQRKRYLFKSEFLFTQLTYSSRTKSINIVTVTKIKWIQTKQNRKIFSLSHYLTWYDVRFRLWATVTLNAEFNWFTEFDTIIARRLNWALDSNL